MSNATESKIDAQEIRPPHTVMSGMLLEYPEAPGVHFVWPTHSDRHGYPQNSRGFSIPLVLVTKLVTSDELIAAAERIGGGFSMTQTLRRAVKAWLRSDEARTWPSRQDGESRDEAILRLREEWSAKDAERKKDDLAQMREDLDRKEAERVAAMSPAERDRYEAEGEIIHRYMGAMNAELDALREAAPRA